MTTTAPTPSAGPNVPAFQTTMLYIEDPESIFNPPILREMGVKKYRHGLRLERRESQFGFVGFTPFASHIGLCATEQEAWKWFEQKHLSRIGRAEETIARSKRRLEQARRPRN